MTYQDSTFDPEYTIKAMQISFVQEMILFINSIICNSNSEIIKYILVERLVHQFHEHFCLPAPITKNVQYYAVARF